MKTGNSSVGRKYWKCGSKDIKEVEKQIWFGYRNVRTEIGRFDFGGNK